MTPSDPRDPPAPKSGRGARAQAARQPTEKPAPPPGDDRPAAPSATDDPALPPRKARARRATRSTAGHVPSDPPPRPAPRDSAPEREPQPARKKGTGHPRFPVTLEEERIDPDVQKVVRRLVRHGYEAYLVGGCVRDLLLDRLPKDFDVATSARPEQVRELFRNSRVIGRRFRLVHVLFGAGKVIEVATFRRSPHEDLEEGEAPGGEGRSGDTSHLLIRSDNVFGEAHEDAMRRDFTINALFYDLEAGEVLDWVGGLGDVERRVVNTIGEPTVRFREDPIRILRALKFAGRLDLGLAPEVYDAVVSTRQALELAARPRLSEEILRLMRGGQARRTVFLAWETGVLDVLLPELSALLYDSFGASTEGARAAGDRVFRLLEFVDRRFAAGDPLDDSVLWTLLLLEPLKEVAEGSRDRGTACMEVLEPIIERLAVPRRFADSVRRIVAVLPRLVTGKVGRFARTELFDVALDVAEAELFARGLATDAVTALRSASPTEDAPQAPRSRRSGGQGGRGGGRLRPTPRH